MSRPPPAITVRFAQLEDSDRIAQLCEQLGYSEAELHILKQRMVQRKRNKAQRGELGFQVPIGYLRRPSGEVRFDPDEQVQQVVKLIFRKFEELGTLNAVLRI